MDWAGLMRAGLTGLRLHPRDFWALTPAELQLLLGADSAARPLLRTQLDDLLARFPDYEMKDCPDG